MTEHLVLIGFKAVGKTALGKAVAERLKRPFADLDEEIVKIHTELCAQEKNCRELVSAHGEVFFRALETTALEKILAATEPLVLALGGGAPLSERNQKLLVGQRLVHVTATRSTLLERYLKDGAPADQFQSLWAERMPVYERLAKLTVQNDGTLEETTEELLNLLA
jgi:shikimate kinase